MPTRPPPPGRRHRDTRPKSPPATPGIPNLGGRPGWQRNSSRTTRPAHPPRATPLPRTAPAAEHPAGSPSSQPVTNRPSPRCVASSPPKRSVAAARRSGSEAGEALACPCSSLPGRRASACRAHGRCSRRGRPVRAGDGRAPDRYVGSGVRTERSGRRAPSPPSASERRTPLRRAAFRGEPLELDLTATEMTRVGQFGSGAQGPRARYRGVASGRHGRPGRCQVAGAVRVTPYARPSPYGGPWARRAPVGTGARAPPEVSRRPTHRDPAPKHRCSGSDPRPRPAPARYAYGRVRARAVRTVLAARAGLVTRGPHGGRCATATVGRVCSGPTGWQLH